MPFPVALAAKLIPKQRLTTVGTLRKGELSVNVGADRNQKNPFPTLWNTKICRVQNAVYHAIMQTIRLTEGVISLKFCKVIKPILFFNPCYFGIHKHQFDIPKILSECGPSQPTNIFDKHRARTNFTNGAKHCRKHIPTVIVAFVFPPD